MREHKFRVWEPLNKKMEHLKLALYKSDDTYNRFALPSNNQLKNYTFMNLDAIEIMESTEVKDKNDIEIYEGDVIKGKEWSKGKSFRHIGVVTYIGSSFKSVGVKQYYGYHGSVDGSYEVIGNIYENPELIE